MFRPFYHDVLSPTPKQGHLQGEPTSAFVGNSSNTSFEKLWHDMAFVMSLSKPGITVVPTQHMFIVLSVHVVVSAL